MRQDFQLCEEDEEEKTVKNPSTPCSSILTIEEETWSKGLWFLATPILPEEGFFLTDQFAVCGNSTSNHQ